MFLSRSKQTNQNYKRISPSQFYCTEIKQRYLKSDVTMSYNCHETEKRKYVHTVQKNVRGNFSHRAGHANYSLLQNHLSIPWTPKLANKWRNLANLKIFGVFF
jgi:hypothetical protein